MSLSILIVEDSPVFAAALKRMLEWIGHRVTATAVSYDEAVAYLQSNKPDVVLTDIMLTGPKTGIDVATYINDYLQIPFIFQSSVTDLDIIKQAFDCHPVAFLKKPVSKEMLSVALAGVQLAD